MATTIASGVPATAVNGLAAWRNAILLTSDSYRVVLYSDGTDLKMASSSTGVAAWTLYGTVLAGITTMDTGLIHAVMTESALYVFSASGTAITTKVIPYTTGGTWGAIASPATFSTLAYTPQAIRAVYDPAGLTSDSGHTSGTGIVHVLADAGNTWHLFALDPHNSPNPKIVQTGSVATSIANPTYATNLLLRKAATLFGMTATATGWVACEVPYVQTGSSGSNSVSGTSSWTLPDSGGYVWSSSIPHVSPNSLDPGTYEWRPGSGGSSGISPIFDGSPGSTWGFTITPQGVYTYPAGTWRITCEGSYGYANASGTPAMRFGARIYERLAGGALTLLGTIPAGPSWPGPGSFDTATASLPSFSLHSGSVIYVEPFVEVDTGLTSAQVSVVTSGAIGMSTTGITLVTPVPTYISGSSTTYTYSYQPKGLETPALPVSNLGAALAVGDTTTDPIVDIVLSDLTAQKLVTAQRSPTGGYTNPTSPWGSSPLPTTAPAIASNTTNGDEGVLVKDGAAFTPHTVQVKRTAGAWSGASQFDTSPTLQRFAGLDPGKLAQTGGQAIAYTNAATPVLLVYEDAGAVAGSQTPAIDTFQFIATPGATYPDVFGQGAIFNVTTTRPFWSFVYRIGSLDPMGAYYYSGGYYTPGKLAVSNGPTNGQAFVGQVLSGTPTKGTAYSATAQAYDSIAGNVSGSTPALTLYVWDAPVVTITAPSVITSRSFTVTVGYTQAQTQAMQQWRVELLDSSNTVIYDSGVQTGSCASGSSFTTPTLTASNLVNRSNYTMRFTAYATPTAGAPFAGYTTLPLATNFPTPAVPTSFMAPPVPGRNPLQGGYVQLRWNQVPSTPATDHFNVYRRERDTGLTILLGTVPCPVIAGGSVTLGASDYTAANALAYDYLVTACDVNNYESAAAVVYNVILYFRLGGLVLNLPSDPTVSVELGLRKAGDPFPQHDPVSEKDFAQLFNRQGYIVTDGPFYTYQTSSDMTYLLETGYERATFARLRSWDKDATELQLRDSSGLVYPVVLDHVSPTQDTKAIYRAVVLAWKGSDPRPANQVALVVD